MSVDIQATSSFLRSTVLSKVAPSKSNSNATKIKNLWQKNPKKT
jgi:hypothetical protein